MAGGNSQLLHVVAFLPLPVPSAHERVMYFVFNEAVGTPVMPPKAAALSGWQPERAGRHLTRASISASPLTYKTNECVSGSRTRRARRRGVGRGDVLVITFIEV